MEKNNTPNKWKKYFQQMNILSFFLCALAANFQTKVLYIYPNTVP